MPTLRKDARQCWIWPKYTDRLGYGQMRHDSKVEYAHRVVYELLIGPIPEGLEIDHLCRNPSCVNPWHLEPVTHRENLLRAPTNIASINARKTHCVAGHEFTPANTYRRKDRGVTRECRKCRGAAADRSHKKARAL